MQTVAYLRWSPAQSPVRIEFPVELLEDVRVTAEGSLEGTVLGEEIRLVAAKAGLLPGVRPTGVFFSRKSSGNDGGIFLTEAELETVLRTEAKLALVVCGDRAGFFVRERDGTMECLRSYEEFAIPKPGSVPLARVGKPVAAVRAKRERRSARGWEWGWVAMAGALLVTLPTASVVYLRPRLPAPLKLAVKEHSGQLLVSWNPQVDLNRGRIEILDGRERAVASLAPSQSRATYVEREGQLVVTLRTNAEVGKERTETVVFRGTPRAAPKPLQVPAQSNADLERTLGRLRADLDAGRARVEMLERSLASISLRSASLTPAP